MMMMRLVTIVGMTVMRRPTRIVVERTRRRRTAVALVLTAEAAMHKRTNLEAHEVDDHHREHRDHL